MRPRGLPFRHGPLTTLTDLEEATSAWVHCYNNNRLMHHPGRRPPTEAEADYYARTDTANPAAHTT
jgi:putative transposase